MKLLAFDTSTETMSVAVCRDAADGSPRIWQHSAAGGAKASSTLIPAIMALLNEAGLRLNELDAIAFGAGPGSFTGLRTTCSVAQGLGFGANVPLLPVGTLLALAEQARQARSDPWARLRVVAALDARMDEIYVARYEFNDGEWARHGDFDLIRPEQLVLDPSWVLAGNVAAAYGSRLVWSDGLAGEIVAALPCAVAMLHLAPALIARGRALPADQALPCYIRDQVAKTTQQRAAEKLTALAA